MLPSCRSLINFLRTGPYVLQLKGSMFFFSLVGIIVFVRLFDLESVMSRQWVDEHLRSKGMWGVGIFMALATALAPLGVPRQALSALGGYAFGALMGTVWTSIALMAGCLLGFFYARLLGRKVIQQKFGRYISRLEAVIMRKPFIMSMAIRLFPFGNNALTNIAAGVTNIPLVPFVLGSGVGYLPQTVIFALLGSGIRVEPMFRSLIAAALFFASSFFGYYLYRKYKNDLQKKD